MPDQPLLVILLILAVAVLFFGGLVFLFLNRSKRADRETAQEAAQRAANLEHGLHTLFSAQSELGGRLDQLTEGLQMSHTYLTQILEERLGAVHTQLGRSLFEQAERTQETLGNLSSRLAVIDEAQKNIIALSGQVVTLQEVLANRQARGTFGEIQLGDLVRNALPPNAYAFQTTLKNGRRVDCLVNLPNPPGPIAIDAKFPLESYRALREAKDDAGRLAAQRQFKADVQKHIKDIAERYISPGETADSALMFLPSEAVYAELHASLPDVVEEGFRRHVWIVSPTTLMATLNTVRAILKDAKMREQAHAIRTEVLKMNEDVRRLNERATKLKRDFSASEKDIDDLLRSTEAITRRMVKIEAVQVEDGGEAAESLAKPQATKMPSLPVTGNGQPASAPGPAPVATPEAPAMTPRSEGPRPTPFTPSVVGRPRPAVRPAESGGVAANDEASDPAGA